MATTTPLPLATPMARTSRSPIVEAQSWVAGKTFAPDRPLLNVSQAAPMAPPPLALRQEIARLAVEDDEVHLYGAVLGLDALRAELARQVSTTYHAQVNAADIAITSGANEAFTAVMSTLAASGDEVILPTPWYFNHKMWCDMAGVTAVPLPTGADMLPDLEQAASLITPRTRAIVLVTPNNPAGVEYPSELLTKFYVLARTHGIALVVDETYRDFDAREGAPHILLRQPDWRDTLVQIYSFSKAYRLTGHRVGALTASPERLLQVEKYLDTVTICPNQLGQRAALWGVQNLGDWLAGERDEILKRRRALEDGFAPLAAKGWTLLGTGGFFAYVAHPFDMASSALAPWLVDHAGVLVLPATFFTPAGDPRGARELRIAFANLDCDAITDLLERLQQIDP
ncbi:aminotransferase [Celeribacter marinus]|uniref:aminotransferase n=1 Tax=Celeribacter marinus TaxID=1397108 RepID=UPI0031735BC8